MEIGGDNRGSIGALMQSDVKMVNPIEKNTISVRLCFLDQFVPECTEAML